MFEALKKILKEVTAYPLCDYFLRESLTQLREEDIQNDWHFFCFFHNPTEMQKLERIFQRGMEAFALSKEELRARSEFNFDASLNKENFEAFRGVLRAGAALKQGCYFETLELVKGHKPGDVLCRRDGNISAMEVKTWVYMGTDWIGGNLSPQKEKKRRQLVQKLQDEWIPKAKTQLHTLATNHNCSSRILMVVLNRDIINWWFTGDDFRCVYEMVREKLCAAAIDYSFFLNDSEDFVFTYPGFAHGSD